MITKDRCRRQLAQVRESASSSDAAYVARTRLKRLVLTCTRMIARDCGLQEPVLPVCIDVQPTFDDRSREISASCTRLLESAEILCQPSEPLDARWKSGWASVNSELDHLDQLLR
jgi:hypothetical protein